MHKRIYCDCDGVIAGFIEGLFSIYGVKEYPKDRQMNFDCFSEWGIDENDFWQNKATVSFWENLPVLDGAHDLIDLCNRAVGINNVFLLTSPGTDSLTSALATQGKKLWINKHFPQFTKKVIFTTEKYACAGSNNYLIDDSDHNLELFEKGLGDSIRYPRPWNVSWQLARDGRSLEVVKETIKSKIMDVSLLGRTSQPEWHYDPYKG